MTWQQLEKMFNRALSHSFSKRKWLLVFPVLSLCGLFIAISRGISIGSSRWIQMTLAFLPIFLVSGFLLAVGIVLIRIYHHEVKGRPIQYLKTIKGARDLFLGITYLAVPLIFAYLVLWMFMGVFYLLRAIPKIGEVMGSILAFGPFLLVLGALLLSILNLLILFYITPAASLKSHLRPQLAEEVYKEMKTSPFLAFVLPLLALLPLLLTVGILTLAATLTQMMYVEEGRGIFVALKWFFMMLPFCAILAPVITFFFNFSAESYVLMRKTLSDS